MKVFLISIFDISKSWGLSTYVKSVNNLLLENDINSDIITPFTNNRIYSYIFNSLILISKIIYVLNNNLWLKLYYRILSKSIYFQIKNLNYMEVIFHFQDVVSCYYINYFLKNIDIHNVLTLHWDLTNMNLSDWIIKTNSKWEKYSLFIEKKWYEWAQKIIAVDNRLYNHAIWYWISDEKIIEMPNFTNTTYFKPDFENRNSLRKKYNISIDRRIIFCPRRLVEKNWVIYTIDIISKLSNDYILIITWEWQEKQKVLNKINELWVSNMVILTWDIPNTRIIDYYRLSDLVIVPSISSSWVIEATSISTIESMACWIPVVASNIWWLRQIITDWVDWFLIEEKNIQEFIKKINFYFDLSFEEKEKISNMAIVKIQKKFSEKSYFKWLENIYTNLIK